MLLFNRYQYQPSTDLIGRGELTRVYKALDKEIYLPVAVKIYRGTHPTEKFGFVQVKKFIAMDHPNICRYLHIEEVERQTELGEKERTQVCVMELVPDGDFGSYFRERKDPDLLRKMITDILRGVAYLHSNGIVHRRLKPSNLLVGETTQGPVVKITDFGLGSGKAALRDARLSSIVLEVTHMAPEQFNPRKYGVNGKISYHIDFWAIGLAIYEALTNGDVLFKNSPIDSREQVIQNILSPELPEKVRRLPPPFDRVVARCLAKHAEERAQNIRELLEMLAQPITKQDDVYETLVLPAMARQEEEQEEPHDTAPVAVAPVAIVPMAAATTLMRAAETQVTRLAPVLEPTVQNPVLFNRYEYDPRTGFIGKGGFSRVYKALDRKLNRWVALKLYKTGEFADRSGPLAEIRHVINLDHPNICRYLDIEEMEKENTFGEKEMMQICVMELLDGGNLLEYYTSHPNEEVLKKLLTDVLKGLEYLHKNGVIHRDIKPANILIRETVDGPVAKITDFGISKLSDSINQHSSSALVVSIPYMAPEQLNVKKYGINEQIGYNLDLWSLGATLYETLTGKVLFRNSEQETSEQIMTNILAPELPAKIAELPQPFLEIVRRCIVKDARQRVQRAEELIELLYKPTVGLEPVGVPELVVVPESVVVQPKVNVTPPESVVVQPTVTVTPPEPVVVQPKVTMTPPEPMLGVITAPDVKFPEPEVRLAAPVGRLAAPVEEEMVLTVMEKAAPFVRKPRTTRRRRRLNALRIAIAAVAILSAMSLYIYVRNQQPETASSVPPRKVDSTKINPGESPTQTKSAASGTGVSGTGATPAHTDPVKKTRREKKSAETPAEGGTESPRYVLLLSAPATCSISINDAPYGVLESGRTMKVYLSPGNYIIQAKSTSDSSDTYTGRLVVQRENLNQVGKYKIPL